ncbi:hypothetical protein WR164_15080 [Philodulcilactobacillus myokoensis]|uniref:Uncharacterized protein n=1 Tax=Philodulcilactobacillus myokoensis TaxID=2929573 RepID=A0A9W6EUQ6_9LACO|nr:hypothetical protein WR164_15080 [Philodulcilactobacillus myokoensis]
MKKRTKIKWIAFLLFWVFGLIFGLLLSLLNWNDTLTYILAMTLSLSLSDWIFHFWGLDCFGNKR